MSVIQPNLSIVVATGGTLLAEVLTWEHIPPNHLRFLEGLVRDKTGVMGSRTFTEILGSRPILLRSMRHVIVLTRRRIRAKKGSVVPAGSVEEAAARSRRYGNPAYVIGGIETFDKFLPLAQRVYRTYAYHRPSQGRPSFPDMRGGLWHENCSLSQAGHGNDITATSYQYIRAKPGAL